MCKAYASKHVQAISTEIEELILKYNKLPGQLSKLSSEKKTIRSNEYRVQKKQDLFENSSPCKSG